MLLVVSPTNEILILEQWELGWQEHIEKYKIVREFKKPEIFKKANSFHLRKVKVKYRMLLKRAKYKQDELQKIWDLLENLEQEGRKYIKSKKKK